MQSREAVSILFLSHYPLAMRIMNKNRAGYNRAEPRVWFAWQQLRKSYFSWFLMLLTLPLPDEVLKNQLECDLFFFLRNLDP